MKNELAIIIVNYNGSKDTEECIRSIKLQCKLNYEIIVIDNDSSKEEKDILKKYSDEITIIFNDKNEGFASANNLGIKYALDKEYKNILLINNDTIVEKNSIENMLEKLKSETEIGIVSCSTLYYDNKNLIWFDGGNMDWIKYIPTHTNMKKIYNRNNEDIEVDFISGCCMMIKREVFETVGLLPTDYFMYFEDADFCVKVKDAKYKMIVRRDSIIYHKVSSASGGEESVFSIKWINRNRILFMNKYRSKSPNIICFMFSMFFYGITRSFRVMQYLIKGDKERALAVINGCISGLRNI